ncbi:MAG TPA: hypothetical protein VLR94_00500 [Acidobacteriota bacterium]|nr:hypothetical protein [Acidobacteriota bacterium]
MSRRDVITAVPTRVLREVEGQKAYVHPTVPIRNDAAKYNVLAVEKLENLMLDEIPTNLYNDLNTEIVQDIAQKKIFKQVLPIQDPAELQSGDEDPPTLILDGYVDDYSAGSEILRVAELGLNHAVVTVRIELKDASTADVLGAATITVYERGIARSGKTAVHKAAATVAAYLQQEINHARNSHS